MPKEEVTASAFPIRIFSFILALSILLVAGLGVYIYYSSRDVDRIASESATLDSLLDRIGRADVQRDSQALQYTFTGDPASETSYNESVADIDAAIDEIARLEPAVIPPETIESYRSANDRLNKIKQTIFILVRQGRRQDAITALTSDDHLQARDEHAKGTVDISTTLHAKVESDLIDQRAGTTHAAAAISVILAVLVAFWILALRSIRQYITGRDHSEEQLRLLSSAVESSQDGVQIVDLNGKIIYSNLAVKAIYGYAPEEYLGMQVGSMNADPEFAEKTILPAIEETGGWSGEVLVKHKDGHTFPIWLTTSMVNDSNGQPVAMVGGIRDITAVRNAEQALRESEERYRLLFQNMYEIAWSIEIPAGSTPFENPVTFVSDRVREIIGFSPDDFSSNPAAWYAAIHPDDKHMVDDVTEAIVTLKQPGVRTYRIRHKETGDYIWLEENVVPRIGADGAINGLFGVARDITDRKKSEAVLVDLVEGVSGATGLPFFKSLVMHLNKALEADIAFVGELNRDRDKITTIAVNAHGEPADNFEYDLKGTPCESVVGRSPCVYKSNVQTRFPADRDLVDLNIDAYIGIPLFDSAGQPQGIIVVLYHEAITDTTNAENLLKIFASRAAAELERMGVEQALSRSEEKYRTLFEESKDAVYMASVEGRYLDMNAAGIELLGYDSLEEVQQLDMARDVYAEAVDRDRFLQDLADAGYVKDYELRMKRKDGEIRTFSITSTLVRDEDGNIIGNWGIGRDITQHRLLEEQLIQAQKMESIGRLAGGVAHDFNNFLTAVQGYIEMAITDLPLNSPVKPELVEAARSADRAVEVTRQLLLFSRHGHLKPQATDLNKVISNVLGMLNRLIGEPYSITTSLEDRLSFVMADAGYIEQVLLNLVVNARDAMPDGGEIVVGTQNFEPGEPVVDLSGTSHLGEFVNLWVQDRGEGMDEETKARIFEPFFSTKSVGTGTGLGLSVVYGIVEQHNGWVEVESQPGMGSTFRVFLPVATEPPGKKDTGPALTTVDLRGQGEKVLLVEDEDIVRNLAVKMLAESGYEVAAAADAEQARRLFRKAEGDFVLLFSDVVLPDITGVRLADEFRTRQPDLKVLLASGYTGEVVDQAEIEARGYHFLQKPYSLQDLLLVVRKMLEETGP